MATTHLTTFYLQKHELEQSTVKCMRGLLTSMMRQRDRIERFKESHDPLDSIHAKFAYDTGLPVRENATFFTFTTGWLCACPTQLF